MATTNFLPFNPLENNQENDSAYLIDSLRANGIPTDAIWPSLSANKTLYQSAAFIAAFAQMMLSKGTAINDAPFDTLVAALQTVRLSSDFSATMIDVPYAGSVVFDAHTSSGFDLTLTGNVAASSLINTTNGQFITFLISQDSVGSRTFVWPATFSGVATSLVGNGTICTIPNSLSAQMFAVRPNGQVVSVTPMLWLTPSGLIVPVGGSAVIAASGTVASGFYQYLELVNCSAGPITRNLFDANALPGATVNIKKTEASTNVITVQPLIGGQTIDGFPNVQVTNLDESLAFYAAQGNWWVV